MATNEPIKDHILREYTRCCSDPAYFLTHYCYIQTVDKGRMLFGLHDFQEDAIHTFQQEQYVMVLKARQIGITTVVSGYALWMMLFHKDQNILIIATKQETAKNIITKVKFAFDNLPKWFSFKFIENNKLSIRLANGSQIKAASSTAAASRGESLNLLIIDEAAHIANAEEVWTAAQATLGQTGTAIALSCVTKDTFICTPDGPKQMAELIDSSKTGAYQTQYSVLGVDKCRDGVWMLNNGVQATKKITTKNADLEGSLVHKLWAYKNGKYDWYTMGELEVGDWVSIHYGANIWGGNDDCSTFIASKSPNIKVVFEPKTITQDIAYLLGLYIAEGFCYKVKSKLTGNLIGGSTTISCGDDVSDVINTIGLKVNKYKINHTISSKNFIEFLEYLGFDLANKAPKKIIPARLFSMSRLNIAALLQGIFDGDGCADKEGDVSLVSTSKALIYQVRALLNNFGILSSIHEQSLEKLKQRTYRIANNHARFTLEIYGIQARQFFDDIGFRFNRKQIRRSQSIKHRTKSLNVIPDSMQLVNELYAFSDLSFDKFKNETGLNLNGICNQTTVYKTNHIAADTVSMLYEKYKDKLSINKQAHWDNILLSNSCWQQIKTISDSENEVFDFSLPNDNSDFWAHSVIYNGILGHQSPNGIGNWFYMKYMEAEEYKGRAKQGAFFPVKLDWKVLPSYNQAWREEQDIRLGPQKARQEFDAAFVGSGNTVIDADLIEFYRETYVRDPELKMGPGGDVWVWEQPDYTKSYICVSDVARGEESKDGDYSAFHVIDAKTCAQVAEYKGRIGTTEYGNLLVAIATQYNDALLVIERENVGWAVIQQVINRQYKNLFYMTDDLKVVDEQHRWNTRFNAQEKKALPGFGTSSRTRPLIISKLDTYMREKSVIIRSQRTINELHTFIWENGKAQAAPSMNDDLILSLCIGLWVRDTALELHTRGIEYSKLSLDKMHRPQTYDAIYTGGVNRENPYRFNIANGMEFDLRNLF